MPLWLLMILPFLSQCQIVSLLCTLHNFVGTIKINVYDGLSLGNLKLCENMFILFLSLFCVLWIIEMKKKIRLKEFYLHSFNQHWSSFLQYTLKWSKFYTLESWQYLISDNKTNINTRSDKTNTMDLLVCIMKWDVSFDVHLSIL